MKYLIAFSTLLIGSLYLLVLLAPKPKERWWQCSWCRAYFNEGGDVSNVPPIEEINSHGICDGCRRKQIEELQRQNVLK